MYSVVVWKIITLRNTIPDFCVFVKHMKKCKKNRKILQGFYVFSNAQNRIQFVKDAIKIMQVDYFK